MAKKRTKSRSKKTTNNTVRKTKKKVIKKNAKKRVVKPAKKKAKKTVKKKTTKSSTPSPKVTSQPLTHKEVKKMRARSHPIETILRLIIFFSIIGLIIAGYLMYMHFKPEASSICTFEGKLNCDTVNKSVYSKFLGIPNAIIGAVGYLYFIVWSILMLKGFDLTKTHSKLRAKHLNFLMILFAIIGFGFSLYLLYVETFILYAYCIFCLASLGIITIILILSIMSWSHCMRCRHVMNRIHYKAKGKMCRYC